MALPTLTGKEWTFLLLTLFQLLACNATYALFAPFFPIVAVDYGITQNGVAFLFSSFAATQFLTSIIAGPLATRFGRRVVLGVGVALISVGSVAFGLAPDMAPAGTILVTLLALARMVQGTGAALASVCMDAILADAFPKNRGFVLSLAGSCGGLAWAIGPPLGGKLFVLGGFRLPFLCAGALPPLVNVLMVPFFPESAKTPSAKSPKASDSADRSSKIDCSQVRELAAVPLLWLIPLCTQLSQGCKWSTFDIGIALWVTDEFGFSISEASTCFSVVSLAWCFGAPIMGSISDRFASSRLVFVIFGLVVVG
jgi:MFS family permease